MLSLTLTILCLFSWITHASPLFPRIVFNPNITVPNAATEWQVGTTQTVKWDITGLPDESLTGMVVLGHIEGDDPNEHLQLNPPLAKGFLIKAGQVDVTIPDVPSRSDYIVVVFGDSGNASPKFTITNPNTGNNSTSSASSSSGASTPTSSTSSFPETTISDPIPISGTTITGTPPTGTATSGPVSTATSPPFTIPISPSSGRGSSSTATTSSAGSNGTSAASNTNDNGALTAKPGQTLAIVAFNFVVAVTVSLIL